MTEAFKRNNALLRSEVKALFGDITQNNQLERAKHEKDTAATMEQLIKIQSEATQKQINELEKNINVTLENIKQNNINASGNRDRNEYEQHDQKGNKYGFNRDWKLGPGEQWADNTTAGFNGWKVKAVRYLTSGKEHIKNNVLFLMNHVETKENPINLNEKDSNGVLIHERIIEENNAREIDLLLFNELMNMLLSLIHI